MLGFFMLQALAAVIIALPILSAATGETSSAPILTIGLVLSVGGMIGVTISDRQLAGFVHQQANKGKICRVGLWSWSRHPNYFFEWVLWIGYLPLGWAAPEGTWLVALPFILYLFLTKITGIPFVEARKLEVSGKAYATYVERTSAFFPWPPENRDSSS